MKKYIVVVFIISAITILFINFEQIKNMISKEQAEITIKNYFPIQQNIKYIYEVIDEGLFYEVTSDYVNEDSIQLRIKGNDGVIVSAIQIKEGKAINKITKKEDHFRKNILNSYEFSQQEDILLMRPFEAGTEWTTADNHPRKITNVESKVETAIGTFDAIEVTTESPNKTTVDYYAKDVGLIKSVIVSDNKTKIIVIKEIKKKSPLIEEIEFYYPNYDKKKILNKIQDVEFSTNDNTERVLTEAYKKISKEYGVLTKDSEINSILKGMDGTLHINLNKAFTEDMKRKAVHEGMILQSIVNTMGRLYSSEQIIFTVDNEDYKSSNIKLNQMPMKVNFIDYPLFYDVVVYGGTASGVLAAVSASRQGMDVALIEQGSHVGGMVTGGLGFTDRGNISVIGGITREVFEKIGHYYKKDLGLDFEPHVAENVLIDILKKENIDLYYNKRIEENDGVVKDDKKLISIVMETGDLFFGQVFIDSTYEGDLMAMAGVSYVVGREGKGEYDESFAGQLPPMGSNNFYYYLNAFDESGKLYNGISNEYPGIMGKGDNKVQAYNYRICVTNNIQNQIPFYKPNNYQRENYLLLSAWLNKLKEYENRILRFSDIVYLGKLPNDKYDVNNSGPFSTDLVGGNWEYPDGDYEKREEIINNHKEYIQGMLYFLANDLSVPDELREDVKKWGYASDEFTDNDYWPYQIYVREARRMVGDFVFTESDVRKEKTKYDSIGMGSYGIDTHNVQRYLTMDGYVLNEGELQLSVSPYEIPYRIMIPKISETDNLLVTVCVSASHIAYSSVRMEPQYMIMGEAAGIAASISIEVENDVQNIDYNKLKSKLIENKAVLEFDYK